MLQLILLFNLFFVVSTAYSGTTGLPQSNGEPWPMPHTYSSYDKQFYLNSENFKFQISAKNCPILQQAFDRYYRVLFAYNGVDGATQSAGDTLPQLKELEVQVVQPCQGVMYPSLEMDESYVLTIMGEDAYLSGHTIWGVLRGLETFSQLVHENNVGVKLVNETKIIDFPRFSHRGVLLDSSRHFLSLHTILQNLDAMAYNKMNVFHWHIVDDQAFPYESKTFPDLSRMGAFEPQYTHIYTQEDVKTVIEYARVRGIRVVPEFDTPGHSMSWGKSQKDLLTKCYTRGKENGNYGPIDPTKNSTYTFLSTFLDELKTVFPDAYLHLGGDEVSFACWQSNPEITKFMSDLKMDRNYAKLEQYYMQRLLDICTEKKKGYIVWQEVVDNGVKVDPKTVVEVWKGGQDKEMQRVTELGYRAILSSCWYLNYISYGSDWMNYYKCDPHHFNGTKAQKDLVIGGEVCMWGEYVDSTNVVSRTWPRASAVAERLWSSEIMVSPAPAQPRLEEMRCRMIERGLPVEPVSGPGHCKHEYDTAHWSKMAALQD